MTIQSTSDPITVNSVILAGGRPSTDDPLWDLTKGKPKALLRIGQYTLLEYVVRALNDADSIDKILVVGIAKNEGPDLGNHIERLPDQGSLAANGLAAMDWVQDRWSPIEPIFICSSDIPTISGEIVDDFVRSCSPFDCVAYYCMVLRETMEKRFPGSQRTYVQLGDVFVAGGDVFLVRPELANNHRDLLEPLAAGRKQAWKLAQVVGLGTLLKFLLHKLTIQDVEKRASKVIGKPVKVFLASHAELAMDVDKPQQLRLLREEESTV